MTTAAILLAAGQGSRYDGPTHKLLAEIDGRPLVVHALQSVLEAATAGALDEVIVVTGAVDLHDVLSPFMGQVALVHNPLFARGQATSLDRGVRAGRDRGHNRVVVGLGDQPFVPPSAWSAVAGSLGPIAVATYNGRQRNPVLLERSVWPLLPIDGDEAARVLLRVRPECVRPVACEGFPDDIDTVEDLRRWS